MSSSISVDLVLSLFALTEATRVTAASCAQSPHSQSPSVYRCVQSIAGLMMGVLDDSPLLLETTLSKKVEDYDWPALATWPSGNKG